MKGMHYPATRIYAEFNLKNQAPHHDVMGCSTEVVSYSDRLSTLNSQLIISPTSHRRFRQDRQPAGCSPTRYRTKRSL